jgi:hypothetical protein
MIRVGPNCTYKRTAYLNTKPLYPYDFTWVWANCMYIRRINGLNTVKPPYICRILTVLAGGADSGSIPSNSCLFPFLLNFLLPPLINLTLPQLPTFYRYIDDLFIWCYGNLTSLCTEKGNVWVFFALLPNHSLP